MARLEAGQPAPDFSLEADDGFPAIVVCPASLKLNWERETRKWLPHRSIAVIAPGIAGGLSQPVHDRLRGGAELA